MLRLAAMLFSMIGTTLAGTLILVVLVVPDLGLLNFWGIMGAGILGFVLAMPFSWYVAKRIDASLNLRRELEPQNASS